VKQTTHDGVFDPTGSADSRQMSESQKSSSFSYRAVDVTAKNNTSRLIR
jgi:hypothetical protein